ncbi:MAG: class I SAM-dependent methyltransferase [Chloroflexi bacterium]|nr:class I SAM-dependent methyltransferase [Chloroflexota bacterium]
MPEGREIQVPWVHVPHSNSELQERYNLWADRYEHDMEELYGYTLPQRGAETLARHLPDMNSLILDAGSGTGLVGEALGAFGYVRVVGIDLSPGMLEQAGRKGVYRELHQMTLGEALDFPSDSFDGVVSIGVLTTGHAPPSSLDELIRVTRPGGIIVFSMRRDTYEERGFREKQEALEQEGVWILVEESPEFAGLPRGEPETPHRIYTYRVA